ncbi:MAG: LysR family transcriptional regulator [Pseudomonadota bacterium]
MQTDLIETFLDLAESQSFTATAERLSVTQSTVSARVAALEARLGQRLFRRGRAGTALTPEGQRFEPHARALRLTWAEAQAAVSQPAQAALVMRLGFQPDLVGVRFGDWIGAIRGALPDAALYLEAVFSVPISGGLVAGTLDLGILFTPTQHPDLHYETLGELRFELVSSTQLSGIDEVDLATYVVPDYSPAFLRSHADRVPQLAEGLTTAGQSNLALEVMQALGGASYQPQATVAAMLSAGTYCKVPDAPVLTQAVYGAVHLRHRHRTAHRRIMRALASAF